MLKVRKERSEWWFQMKMDVMNAEQDGWMEINEANHLCSHACLIIFPHLFHGKRRQARSQRIFTFTSFYWNRWCPIKHVKAWLQTRLLFWSSPACHCTLVATIFSSSKLLFFKFTCTLWPHLHKKSRRSVSEETDRGTPENLLSPLRHVIAGSTHSVHYLYIMY